MAMLGLPTSAAEPEHAPMLASSCVGAQPRARRPTATLSADQPTRERDAMLTDFYVAFRDLDRSDLGRPDGPFEEATGSGCVRRVDMNTSMTWPNWSIAR